MLIVLAAVLVSAGLFAVGASALLVARTRVEAARARRRLADAPAPESPSPDRVSDLLQRFGARISAGRASTGLTRDLARAGYHGVNAASAYLGAKLLLLLAGGLVGGAIAFFLLPASPRTTVLVAVAAGGVLFLAPNLVVARRRFLRNREVSRHLPDVVDLLEICVSAGMGIDMAWRMVTDEARRVCGVMADEMELTSLEMSLGVARKDAMRHMAERTGVEEISSLVALLVQSERFGASITEAFRIFAESLREIRGRKAEEAAERTAVKMLFPMALCIFPALLVVAVGPAMLSLARTMG